MQQASCALLYHAGSPSRTPAVHHQPHMITVLGHSLPAMPQPSPGWGGGVRMMAVLGVGAAGARLCAGSCRGDEPPRTLNRRSPMFCLRAVPQPPCRPCVSQPVPTCSGRCASGGSGMQSATALLLSATHGITSRPSATPSVAALTPHACELPPPLCVTTCPSSCHASVTLTCKPASLFCCGTDVTDTLVDEDEHAKASLTGSLGRCSPPWNWAPVAHATPKVALSRGAQPQPGTVHAQTRPCSDDSSVTAPGA